MNLYLSRLILNLRSRQVMSELAHPYEMHRTILRAFPDVPSGAEAKARELFGVLFRVDVDDKHGTAGLYVQSRQEPDWSFLHSLDRYLSPSAGPDGVSCRDVLPAYSRLRDGQLLTFRLRANPTKRNAREGDPLKGKRVELQREDEQIAWLIRKGLEREKGKPGGFELLMRRSEDASGKEVLIPRVDVRPEGKRKGLKRDGAAGHATTHMAVLFDGVLRITDRDAFLETVACGIGSGKAYGFGLLSVAPVRE